VGLEFACTAARLRSGGLWMAVGVHWGFHIGIPLLPLQAIHFGVRLLLTATLALTGAVLLRGQGRISPDLPTNRVESDGAEPWGGRRQGSARASSAHSPAGAMPTGQETPVPPMPQ
jgi:hypothetical protein